MVKQRTIPELSLARSSSSRMGFTALEVAAVVTIIAIMSLVLIPVVRSRVEEARRVAAQDDMAGIEKAESIAFGYCNYYFRLNDLNRPQADSPYSPYDVKPPRGSWCSPFNTSQQGAINQLWKGSFVAYHNTRNIFELETTYPQLFRRQDGSQGRGPILILTNDVDNINNTSAYSKQYPIDPWGNPYVFFGSKAITQYGNFGNPAITTIQSWDTAVVYSMGPDGEPASIGVRSSTTNTAYAASDYSQPASYFREAGWLGADQSDDLKREF